MQGVHIFTTRQMMVGGFGQKEVLFNGKWRKCYRACEQNGYLQFELRTSKGIISGIAQDGFWRYTTHYGYQRNTGRAQQ